MKYFSLILPIVSLMLVISSCTKFDYNNPLDPEGINKSNFETNPEYFLGDEDNDGIVNVIDEDHILNRDTAAPVIELRGGQEVTIDNGSNEQLNYWLGEWDVSDNGGGEITKHQPTHTVNIYKDSCYIVQYSATDQEGNTGKTSRTICVETPLKPDTTPPILTVQDSVLTIPLNSSFAPPKAQAFDLKDGNITSKIQTQSTVDTSTIGEYIVTYTVEDFAKNVSTLTVKIIVKQFGSDIDIGLPVIVLLGNDTVKVPENIAFDDFRLSWDDPGVKATDNVDGDVTANVTSSEFTYINPKYWYIAYNVTDKSGNHAQEVKRIFDTGLPEDIQGPIIELNYPDSVIEVVLGGVWKEPGFLATDVTDHDITDKVVVDSSELIANIEKEGIYSVTYTVINSLGAQTSVIRKVRIVDSGIDTKPPVITLIGKNPDSVVINSVKTYADPGATAEDNRDGDVTANIIVTNGVDMTSYGKYSVIYRVKDEAGRQSTETRTVWVVRSLDSPDILINYGVPSEDPLPDMSNLTFAHVDIDGDGPAELLTAVKSHTINWSARENLLRGFSFQYNASPHYKDITTGITHNFGDMYPEMTIKGSLVPGLDGDYFVTYDGTEFVWVDQDGKFAIIWTK